MGGLQIPRWLGSDPLSAWWLGLAPATLEFWVRFPNERNQGKQAHPVLKYRVPHGSQCVMSGLIHTGLGSSSIIAHVVHSPPPPPANSFVIGPAVINTHKHKVEIQPKTSKLVFQFVQVWQMTRTRDISITPPSIRVNHPHHE